MKHVRFAVEIYRRPLTAIACLTPFGLSVPDQHWNRAIFSTVLEIAPVSVWRVAWFIVAVLLGLSAFNIVPRLAAIVSTGVVTCWVWAVLWSKVFGDSPSTWGGIFLWATYLAYVWLVTERSVNG